MDESTKEAIRGYLNQLEGARDTDPLAVFVGIMFTGKHHLKLMEGDFLCELLINALKRELEK